MGTIELEALDFGEAFQGLYRACYEGVPSDRFYFLMRKIRGKPLERIPLAETFDPYDQQKFGWYVFTGQGVREPGTFATRLKAWLDEHAIHAQGALWLADPDAPDIEGQFIDIRRESSGFFVVPMTFRFRNLGFGIDAGEDDCEIRLEEGEGPDARFAISGVLTAYAAEDEPAGKVVSPLCFSLWGDDLGVLRFDLDVDTEALLAYGGDLRYYRSGQAAAFRFPFLDVDAAGGSLRLGAHLAPLAIEDVARTRYVLPAGPLPSFLETVAGHRVDVSPEADGNLTLAHVLESGGGPPDFYLCPSGGFALALPGANGGDRLPCGLFGAEFVRLHAGDGLRLVAKQPAFIPEPTAPGRIRREMRDERGEGRITSDATTSWMSFKPGPADVLAYFAQPDLSIYHGRTLPDASRVVGALDVRLSSLDGAAFPAVPYAGAGLVAGGKPVNPGLGPADFRAIEADALSPMRQQLIPAYPRGPCFEAGDTNTFAVRAAESSFGLTPQGLVARLNADRTWAELLLATSPDPDGKLRTLGFLPDKPDEDDAVLARTLADALMKNDLFLVVSARMPVGEDGATNVGRFLSELTLDGFTFDLSLAEATGKEPAAVRSVVVFKFKPQALEDLAKNLDEWTEPARFNQTVSGEVPAQKVLLDALDVPDDPRYEHFRRVIRDPNWNGILAVNTAIAGSGLPLAVQGLRGGMPGSLVGHHVGIEVNSVDLASGALPERCSAFAFLTMKNLAAVRSTLSATPGPFDYRVDRFHVSFIDSTIVDFVCDVKLDLNELFDRPLVQDPPGVPANEMLIKGHYELRDGEAAFSFTTDRAYRFLLQPEDDTVRFLKALSVAQARFVTKSAVRDPDTKLTEVRAAFELDGGLVFDAGDTLPFDVLGYGENNPLSFSSLGLTVSFEMTDAGDVIAGTRDLQFDPASLSLASAKESQPSPGSLVSSFPLTLDSFDFNPEGLSPSQLGADWVNSNELLEFWNPTPRFALTFTLPLGSLGALSSVHVSLDARFVVGWGPHPTIPDDDGIGIAVALPQVTPGFRGFNLQGVLKTAFGSCALVKLKDPQQKDMFVLAFNNIALSILGFALPPGYIISFLITANPDRKGGQGAGNLAWLAAVQVDESGKRVLDAPAGGTQ